MGVRIHSAPPAPAASGANAIAVGDAASAAWARIFASLAPIIGTRGVLGLYQRSIHLAEQAHPCLKGAAEAEPDHAPYETLVAILSAHPDSQAAGAANAALLKTFTDLLSGLIGPRLTQQLLDPVALAPSLPIEAAKTPGDHHDS